MKVLDALHRTAGSSFARCSCGTSVAMGCGLANPFENVVDTIGNSRCTVHLPSQFFLLACILWRDGQRWLWQQAVGNFFDPAQQELARRHSQPGEAFNWERVFIKSFGSSWKREAASSKWKQLRGEFRVRAYGVLDLKPFEDRHRNQAEKKSCALDGSSPFRKASQCLSTAGCMG